MTTLYEFLTKIYRYGHFTIFEPNRDCLIYESFLKYHSSCKLTKTRKGYLSWDFDKSEKYFKNNPFVEEAWHHNENCFDKETKLFLEKYGDYEVHGIETSRRVAYDIGRDKDGKIKLSWNKEKEFNCVDIFICVPDPKHEYFECERCTYSKLKEVPEKTCHRGFIQIPDDKCLECRNCPKSKEIR